MAWFNRVSLGNFADLAGVVNNLSESVKNIERNLGLEDLGQEAQQGAWVSPDGFIFDPAKNNIDSIEKKFVQEDANSSKSPILDQEKTNSHGADHASKEDHKTPDANEQNDQVSLAVQEDETGPLALHQDEQPTLSKVSTDGNSASVPEVHQTQTDVASSNAFSVPNKEQELPESNDEDAEHKEIAVTAERNDVSETESKFPDASEAVEDMVTSHTEEIPDGKDSGPSVILTQSGENDGYSPKGNLMTSAPVSDVDSNQLTVTDANTVENAENIIEAKETGDAEIVVSQGDEELPTSVMNMPASELIEASQKDNTVEQFHSEPSTMQSSNTCEVNDDLLEANKLKEHIKFLEAAIQGAARQSQAKADEISRLLIENEHLKSTIEDVKRKSFDSEAEALRDEYQQRLGMLERKVYSLTKERDTLRRENSRKSDTAALLKEKDEIIKQVMAEGEELSKKQAAQESQMRKLRAQIRSLEEEKQRLTSKLQVEEAKVESIKKDKAATEKALQEAVENSQAELAAQKEYYTNALNEAKDAQALAEARANSEAKTELENRLQEGAEREAALIRTVEELREMHSNTERQAASREDALQNQIAQLQKSCQETEMRYEELVMRVPESTRPLLRQIEAMQESAAMRAEAWSGVERSLNARLQEAEAKAASAEERERTMNERLSQTLSRMAVLEAQVSCLRTENGQLSRTLEKERQRASESRQEYLAALETAASQEGRAKQLEAEMIELRNQHKRELIEEMTKRELLEQELEQERMSRLDLEKRSNNEIWPVADQNASSRQANSLMEHGSNYHLRRYSSATSTGSMEESFYLQASLESSSEQILPDRKSETSGSPYIGRSIMPTTLEHLESTLRKKDGELASYMARLASLESIRDSLAEELVKMTNECEKLRIEVATLPGLKAELEALRARHASALELMGERDEELEELRADLSDVKEMYREQVDLLVSQIEKLSSSLASK